MIAPEELRRRHYLSVLGITRWELREPPAPVGAAPESMTEAALVADGDRALGSWAELESAVRACTKCSLHTSRTQTVFGVGSHSAQWMFIGEAPGADEDRQGEPFVGRAGQLLNAMLFALGLQRDQVYIANVLKCRPPGNRDPQPNEVDHCESYLQRQIELVRPRLIVALGRHAAHSLLKTEAPLSKLRGQRLTYHGTPLVVTYHPAYLLRNPIDKSKTWQDLSRARLMIDTADKA